jgi:hypothetical protein
MIGHFKYRILFFTILSVSFFMIAQSRETMNQGKKMDRVMDILRANPLVPQTLYAGVNLVDGKCGFKLNCAVKEYWNTFSLTQQMELRKLMTTSFEKTRIIGHFEINYDTSDSSANTPALLDSNGERVAGTAEDYVDSVGKYFNYAWTIEIDSLGFLPPPFQTGHSHYVINIQEFGTSAYGWTQFADQISGATPSLWATYIEIDNDYLGFYSEGIAGLRVTSAHEFNHSIQIGRYGYWGIEGNFYLEMTSTWLEDYVHNDVNDYYQYIKSPGGFPRGQFESPDISFVSANGLIEYSRAIWGKYIEKRFSPQTMRETWERIRFVQPLAAINQVLVADSSSLQDAFLEWTLWNYYTGRRADTIAYYSEGMNYPLVREKDTTYYVSPSGYFTDSLQALSSVYHPINLNQTHRFFTVISNINAQAAIFSEWQPVTYLIQDATDATYKWLDSLVYVKLSVSDAANWKSQESVPAIEPLPVRESARSEVSVYPNPLKYTTTQLLCDDCLHFVLPKAVSSTALLLIYSSDFRLIFNGDVSIDVNLNGEQEMTWHSMTNAGDKIASGIYIYSISVDNKEYHGKFAVVQR